ncbi:MAG: aminotransferase class I/II-fold pyridoxal phosphate-dependent enzyme [Chromatiaceae bacterium]
MSGTTPLPVVVGLAKRARAAEPFHVMRLLARARVLEAAGRSIAHLEIGEPDFPTPEPVVEAARRALAAGHTHYTPAAGLPALRAAIAGYYGRRYAVSVDPARILLLAGLQRLGFGVEGVPSGAFYVYARLPDHVVVDSMTYATRLLEEVGVAVTPGADFGDHQAERHLRFAYTCGRAEIDCGLGRIERFPR